MKSLSEIQKENKVWAIYNFGIVPLWQPMAGINEETGELNHHVLKRSQKIRTNEDHNEGIKDAVADILLYLINFCNIEGIDLEKQLNETWAEVKQRNWRKNKETGKPIKKKIKK